MSLNLIYGRLSDFYIHHVLKCVSSKHSLLLSSILVFAQHCVLPITFSRDLAQTESTAHLTLMTKIINLDFLVLTINLKGKGACFSSKHNGKLVLVCLCLSCVFIMGLGAQVQFPLSAAIGLDKRDEWKDITRQEGLSIAAPRGRWRWQPFDGVQLILWEPLIYADCAISLWGICNFLQVWSITAALLHRMLTMSQSKNGKKQDQMRTMGGER